MSHRIPLVITCAVAGLILVALAIIPLRAAGQATSTPSFTIDQTFNAIWGNVSPGDVVTVARGTAYGAAQADGVGFFWTPLWQPNGQPADITGTDTVSVYVNGGLSGTVGVKLATGQVDVLNDRVVGTISGAASTPVTASLGTNPGAPSVITTTDASGHFTATFAAVDLAPNQNVAVEYRSGLNTLRAFVAPARVFAADLGWNEVTGYAQPGQVVTATVYTGTGSLVKIVLAGQADRSQGFYDLYPSDATTINSGDKVEVNLGGGTLISTTAAVLTMGADLTNNRVVGTAPSGALVRANLWRWTGDKDLYYQVKTTADATGVYTANFSGVTNLQVFDWIQVAVADSGGNETALSSGAPMININETANQGWARVDGPNLAVTSTLDTGSGIYTQIGKSGANGFVSIGQFPGGPDIQPGHRVTVETASWLGAMTVANVNVAFDTAGNRLLGDTPAGRIETTISHPWSNLYPAGLGSVMRQVTSTSPFTITYTDFDLRDGDNLWIVYYNSEGFRTARSVDSHFFQANIPYGVGAPQFSPSDVLTATLYQSDGVTLKSQTSQDTESDPTWYQMDLQGQIATGDWLTVTDGLGWTSGVQVPNLTTNVSAITDTVWGQCPKSLLSIQRNWDWSSAHFVPCDDYKLDAAYYGMDLLPSDRIQTMYFALNGDRVVAEGQAPAPHLRMNMQPQGTPGEGGNMTFRIEYWNDGDLAAENTYITDTLEGMSYISALSPVTPTGSGSGPIVWSLGTLPAQSYGQFDVFVHVTSPAFNTITNTVQIATSNPNDQGDPKEKNQTWTGQVEANDTHLNVNKDVWTGDPLPGSDFVWSVQVCNNGSTDSSEVILTDTLPLSNTLVSWWGQYPGWTEVSRSSNQLVVSRPSMRSGWCAQVYIRSHLDANVPVDTQLTNTAVITAANDIESGDNTSTRDINVGRPHTNLRINKNWNWGELTPGGELRYNVDYGNNGNLPVTGIRITDTLPVSTTFIGAWRNDDYWWNVSYPVTPALVAGNIVVWNIGALDNGYSNNFEVALRVNNSAIPGTVLTNTVTISPQPDEDAYYDNTSAAVETLRGHGPNLRVYKSHNWNGDHTQLNYDVTFENVGDQTVNDVWITDTYPLSTSLSGSPGWKYWEQVNWTDNYTDSQLIFQLQELQPGWRSDLFFTVNVDPNLRPHWYTNTVEIGPLAGDVNPADNTFTDLVVNGEVDRAELWLEPAGSSNMWGQAVPGLVTITTAYTQVTTYADSACNGCWPNGGPNPDVGPVQPGDVITVAAGNGLLPVVIHVPYPFTAQADSNTDRVWGQVGGWTNQVVEIHGYWSGGYKEVTTDAAGNYTATFSDVPRGASGYVRYVTQADYAEVIFHHPFQSPDLLLNVHYRDDWVEGNYPVGYTILLTVTGGSGTLKGTAVLTTGVVPWWNGQTGFSTNWQGWTIRPDIVPDDWVYGRVVENGYTTAVRVGTITGNVDAANDRITGTVNAGWYTQTLAVRCDPWGAPGGAPSKDTSAGPNGAPPYACQWNPATEWDVLPGQDIAVFYYTPDANQVGNAFREPAPDLRVEKWVEGNSEVAAGGAVVYSIRYQNQGDGAGQAILTDTLPANTTYIADSSGFSAHISGNVITWSLGSVLPYTLPQQFQLVLTNSASVSDTLNNQVDIDALYDTNTGDNHAEAQVDVGSGQPDLYVNKNPEPGDPAPGQLFRYRIDYGNNGPVASGPVWLTDTLPLSTTLVGWQSENNYNLWTAVVTTGGQLALYAPALPGNYGDRILLTLRLDGNASYGTQLFDAVVITTTDDGDPNNNSQVNDQAWVSPPRYDVAVNKNWDHGSLVPGGEINYDIRYNNNGNSIAPNVIMTDTLPSGTALVTSVVDLGWGVTIPLPPSSIAGNQLVWNLGSLPVNTNQALRLTLRVDSAVSPGTTLTNCATLTASSFEDNPYDNASCHAETVRSGAGPDLDVAKYAYWQSWDRIQYQMRIRNVGGQAAYNVTVTETYPLSMTMNWWNVNCLGRNCWNSPAGSNPLTVTFEVLYPGDTTWLNMELQVPSVPNGTLFTNTAEIDTPPGDTHPDDNRDTLVVGTGPDLSIEKRLTAGTPKPGQLLTYTLHFSNQSSWWTSGHVWITDALPTGLVFVSATQRLCGGTYFCERDPDRTSGSALAWDWNTNGTVGTYWWQDYVVTARVTDTAKGGDVLTNTASIASDNPSADVEPFLNDNTSAVAVTVLNPVFQLSKGYAGNLVVGTPLTYTITVTNVGNETATGVVVTDALPSAIGNGMATWSNLTIPLNGGVTKVITNVTLPCSAGVNFTNQAYRVASSNQGVTSGFGPALALTTISPTLSAALSYGPSLIVVSNTVMFTGTSSTNGTPLSYAWDFGDGSGGSGLTTSHVYTRAGSFTVVFTAADACGFSKVATTTLTVAPACTSVTGLNFTYMPLPAVVQQVETFTATYTAADPAPTFAWSFDSGALVSGQVVTHTFTTTGTHTVALTATNTCGPVPYNTTIAVDLRRVYLPVIMRVSP